MERDGFYFLLVALGAVVLWALFRRGSTPIGRMSMIACTIAVAIAYAVLFGMV
jgi:hypothetical protein